MPAGALARAGGLTSSCTPPRSPSSSPRTRRRDHMARLFANENLPQPVVLELRRLGHEVLTNAGQRACRSGRAGQRRAGVRDRRASRAGDAEPAARRQTASRSARARRHYRLPLLETQAPHTARISSNPAKSTLQNRRVRLQPDRSGATDPWSRSQRKASVRSTSSETRCRRPSPAEAGPYNGLQRCVHRQFVGSGLAPSRSALAPPEALPPFEGADHGTRRNDGRPSGTPGRRIGHTSGTDGQEPSLRGAIPRSSRRSRGSTAASTSDMSSVVRRRVG
jgi:hypothetical protein